MLKIKSFKPGYFLKLAFNGLFKNGVMTISSVFVLLSCLVIMGSFALVSINIDYNIDTITGYEKIVVFAERNTSDADLVLLKEELEAIKGIDKVDFLSNEEALEEQLAKYDSTSEFLLNRYKENNPLKDSFVLTYSEDKADKLSLEGIRTNILNLPGVNKVEINFDVVDQINGLKTSFTLIFTWLLILLFFVSIFVIINTVKLSVYARRDEIALMRYIGATNTFISIPFLIEGLIIGIISAAVAYFVQSFLYTSLINELIGENQSFLQIVPFAQYRLFIIIAFVVIGILTGFVGSLISLRKYNKETA